jgi:catechol 2,3-dioxygenase-like lactoylglutathione lyase family enzyme
MTKQPTTLGAFSVSLAVKDLKASREFYEKLGFEKVMGEFDENWLILRPTPTLVAIRRPNVECRTSDGSRGKSGGSFALGQAGICRGGERSPDGGDRDD